MRLKFWSAVCCCLLLGASPSLAAKCIRGPWLQNARVGSVLVRWELDQVGPSAVEYGLVGSKEMTRVASPFKGRMHRAGLGKLQPGARYRYRILAGDQPASAEFQFRAAPENASKFTFAVFGDFGNGSKEQFAVARLLEKSPAEFALLTGDLIYGRGELENYDLRFFAPYRHSLPRMVFWPALGNHDNDTKQGAALLALFDPPANGPKSVQSGRNYSFDYGNAHIAAIDSNAGADLLKNDIGPWLLKDMQASDKPWKFVFFHHPPYSSAGHGENLKMKAVMVPIFQQAKIDLAFAGHDHSYERSKPLGGVIYIVSGNGGNRLYEHKHPHDYTAKFYNAKHGLTLVTIEGGKLLLRHVNVDGEEIDRLALSK